MHRPHSTFIKVGHESQTARAGTIPGRHFAHGGICTRLSLAVLQTAMDFEMVVRYIGSDRDGLVFDATAVGTAAV